MKKIVLGAVASIAAITLAGCATSGNPLAAPSTSSASGTIVIGSADFTESQLIAGIYAQALQGVGVKVKEQPNIGSREVYMAALKDGSIDLVPEYNGALMSYLDPKATESTTASVNAKLLTVLPAGTTMLNSSPAADTDVLAVTQATADKYNLKTIGDLKAVAGTLVLGGPPEWKTRVLGVVGLQQLYGLTFKQFVSLDAGGPLTMTALTTNQVQVGDIFSTDPGLTANHLVALEDTKSLFAAENVVPVISKSKLTPLIKTTLNAVSAKLTTADLIAMNGEAGKGTNLATIAKEWLAKVGLK